jgi:tRNA A-37 threonylcarbamoyl transferase component Bud32/tetratricopeptide (TPR) repeat protein/TolB-like protein
MSPESGQNLSHYRLVEKIGEGGMGVVWKAEDTVLGRAVAIKVLPADLSRDEERRKMFLDEARLASSVSQAHIVQVFEFGHEGGLDFIVMEYVTGKPLSQVMQGRPLPSEKVAEWGAQVAQALSRAHRKGLLHRDLKPANILITDDGDAKVVDFGLATLFQREDDAGEPQSDLETRTSLESSGSGSKVAGTLAYMSPEQVRGENLTPHSDIFSLGVVLYEMTTGQRPFGGATSADIAGDILKSRPTPAHDLVPKVPLDLERILEKSMASRTGERYQTMEYLAVDLKRLGRDLETGSSPAYEDLLQGVSRPAPERPRWILPAVAVAVLVVVVVVVWVMVRGSSPGGAVAVDARTILVAPLEVRGQSDSADYVGRAFAEAMAVNLAQAKELRVLPIPPAEELGGSMNAEAARRMGAGILLSGALTRGPQTVHASLSMVDTVENRILWGAQKDAPEGDLAGLAATMAREGVEELGLGTATRLFDAPLNLTGSAAMAASAELAETLGTLRHARFEDAVEASARLVEKFPGELDAHILRGAAVLRALFTAFTEEHRSQVARQGTVLERMAPGSPYGSMLLAAADSRHGDVVGQLTELLERDDLTPSMRVLILRQRAWARRNAGNGQAAVVDFEQALLLEPANATTLANLGYVLREVDRGEEALLRVRQAVAMEPGVWFFHHALGHVLSGQGRHEEAGEAYLHACEMSKMQQPCAAYAGSLQQMGRPGEALQAASRAGSMEDSLAGVYNLACFHALRGERDLALKYLRRNVVLGWESAWIAQDPDLKSLHGDPEFEEIVAPFRGNAGD